MTIFRCPICDKNFRDSDPDVAMPFCSRRCKRIDAVRWLGEDYGLPYEAEEDVMSDWSEASDRFDVTPTTDRHVL